LHNLKRADLERSEFFLPFVMLTTWKYLPRGELLNSSIGVNSGFRHDYKSIYEGTRVLIAA
jgi:hypothetical protein